MTRRGAQNALAQVRAITDVLVKSGLASDETDAFIRDLGDVKEVCFGNGSGLEGHFDRQPYAEYYGAQRESRAFNARLIDGGLLQLSYRFFKGVVSAHRLVFLPAPDLAPYQLEPEVYQTEELFGDVIQPGIMTVPIRFDFDDDPKKFVPISHPRSHVTLGQYEMCRIPASHPVTPVAFTNFILSSFYGHAYRTLSASLPPDHLIWPGSLESSEQSRLQLHI